MGGDRVVLERYTIFEKLSWALSTGRNMDWSAERHIFPISTDFTKFSRSISKKKKKKSEPWSRWWSTEQRSKIRSERWLLTSRRDIALSGGRGSECWAAMSKSAWALSAIDPCTAQRESQSNLAIWRIGIFLLFSWSMANFGCKNVVFLDFTLFLYPKWP